MCAALDGQELFDEQQLEIRPDSARREVLEKAVCGLDGVLSIDLGSRSRQIKQRGVLRAKSRVEMDDKINAISAYMDGNTHMLATSRGGNFENLRMDVFRISGKRTSGSGLEIDYEIVYTQLKVWQ